MTPKSLPFLKGGIDEVVFFTLGVVHNFLERWFTLKGGIDKVAFCTLRVVHDFHPKKWNDLGGHFYPLGWFKVCLC